MKLKVIGSNPPDIARKTMVYPTLATVLEKPELQCYQLPVSPSQDLQCYQLPATPPPLQRPKAGGRFAEIIASVVDDIFNIVCILLLLAVIHRLVQRSQSQNC